MRALRDNLGLRTGAWALFFTLVCTTLFLGQQFLFSLWFTWSGAWTTTTAFEEKLNDQAHQLWDYLQYLSDLEGNNLDYVEREQVTALLSSAQEALSPQNTNFRYQILSKDGVDTLDSNVEDFSLSLEQQLTGVYYALLDFSDSGTVGFSPKGNLNSIWDTTAYGAVEQADASLEDGHEYAILRYGVLSPERMTAQDEFFQLLSLYNRYADNGPLYGVFSLVSLGGGAILLLLLLRAAGHRPGQEEVTLFWPDRVFTEVWLALLALGTLSLLLVLPLYEQEASWAITWADGNILMALTAAGTAAAAAWSALATAFLRTLVVRLKARALVRTTLVCRAVLFLWRRFSSFFRELPFTWKTVLFFLVYLAAIWGVDHIWPLPYYYPLPGVLINLTMLLSLAWWSAGFWRVRKGTEVIASGNLNHQIDTARLPGDLKEQAEALNNISHGLTQAVNEQMKSERFKAELITNVSHDLKTPLTSIINYVNLLKTTQQTDSKAQEYIEVLDRKSQRLKKLTEDLVEASKASTGALPVNREKIGVAQLLDQALGEYEERLEGKKLTVVRTLPEGECYVYADGRHLWRVMDNLLSNCAKYALEGTRVYLEIIRGKGSVSLSVKNISREPLNVPPERLMERFVRGEESRTTEGSGLGLSIAKSLTELQGGTFELVVDGDLFKAIVTLPQAS